MRNPFAKIPAPELHNGSVVLRPPTMGDFDEWVRLRSSSRKFLVPWEPSWSEQEFSRLAFRSRIKYYRRLAAQDQGYPFFIFHQQQRHLLGAISITNVRRRSALMCSVGYWIGEAHVRQGHMTAALEAVVHHAFSDLGLHRVEAACLPANAASIALLHRCKFEPEGLARKYLMINGGWQDHQLFARLNPA